MKTIFDDKSLNKDTKNHYNKRKTRSQWIKENKKSYVARTILFAIFFSIIFIGLTLGLVNLITSRNIADFSQWNFSWYLILTPIVGGCLVGWLTARWSKRRYLSLKKRKSNYVKDERSGTAHFLTDERLPWTTFDNLAQKYYPTQYFLAKGDWIVRTYKNNNIDGMLKEACEYFVFSFKNQKGLRKLDDILNKIKYRQGMYKEVYAYTSANDVITDIVKYATKMKNEIKPSTYKARLQGQLDGKFTYNLPVFSESKETFVSKVKSLINELKLKPYIIQKTADAPNAYVLGSTGSGKTTKLIYPTVIANANAIYQPSMLITDPKGELYTKLSGYLTARGYKVFSLDLFNLISSMGWNPMQDTYYKVILKSVIKEFLKQYDEYLRYFNSTLYNEKEGVKIVLDVIDSRIDENYPALNLDEWKYLTRRYEELNVHESNFVFDDRHIKNPTYLNENNVKPIFIKNVNDERLKKYSCGIHQHSTAYDCKECVDDNFTPILIDNLIFKTKYALQVYLNTALPSEIAENINKVSNVILSDDDSNADKHWINSAIKVYEGLTYYLAYQVEDDINSIYENKFNINSILGLMSVNLDEFTVDTLFSYIDELQAKLKKLDKNTYEYKLMQYHIQNYRNRSDYTLLKSFLDTGDKEKGSIVSTMESKVKPFRTDGIKSLTSFSDIKFEDIIDTKNPKAIFIGIDVNNKTYHPFITLFISLLHQRLSKQAKKMPDKKLAREFLFLLEECGNIPAIPNLPAILSTCRSELIKFMLILQSNAQMQEKYKESLKTIQTNAPFNVYIKSDEFDSARYYSDLLGQTTIEVFDKNDGASSKKGFAWWDIDYVNKQRVSYTSRSLMTPEEVLNLDSRIYHDTLFLDQSKPINVMVSPWYKTYDTKAFETYRPIQYKVNEYSINKYQISIEQLFENKDLDHMIKNESVKRVDLDNLCDKTNTKLDSLEEELKKQQLQKESDFNLLNEDEKFYEALFKVHPLMFKKEHGVSLDEFIEVIKPFNGVLDKANFFRVFSKLNMYEFAFEKYQFIEIINQNIDVNYIRQKNNWSYRYNDDVINQDLLIIAKDIITNKYQLDTNLSEIKQQIIKQQMRFIELIMYYELVRGVDYVQNNYEDVLYAILVNKTTSNSVNELYSYFSSLINIVDYEIFNTYKLIFNANDLKIAVSDLKDKQKLYGIYARDYNQNELYKEFWYEQVKDLFKFNKMIHNEFIKMVVGG